MTLYTNVSRNKFNSGLLLLIFLVITILVAWVIGQAYQITWLLPLVVIISLVQSWVAYYYSDAIALVIAHAVLLTEQDNPTVYHLLENLSITAGLPRPKLYLINDSAPNAFATGRDPKHASIAVTSGLLNKLEKSELEGVLAHELSHVGNFDIRFQSMVVVLVGVVTMISDFALRSFWWRGGRRASSDEGGRVQLILMVIGVILAILAPLIAVLIQLAISRKREFLADSTGALLTRYPPGLASALRKIAADPEPLEVANKGTAHLYFANPLKGRDGKASWLQSLFLTHPPVEERIKALLSGGGENFKIK